VRYQFCDLLQDYRRQSIPVVRGHLIYLDVIPVLDPLDEIIAAEGYGADYDIG
jgi:hypothetical protein